jgi:hypothetical protein
VLKNKVNYQRSELPIFVDKVKELIAEQAREAERAVVNRRKYRSRSQYRFLEVPEARWFAMNQELRDKHLSKVQSFSVTDLEGQTTKETSKCDTLSASETDMACRNSGPGLSVPVQESAYGINPVIYSVQLARICKVVL